MITVALQGGLGNQMFQYALGLAFKNRGKDVQYYAHRLAMGQGERAHRCGMPDYGLDKYDTDVRWGKPDMPLFDAGADIHYDPKVWDVESGTVSGFWQSEKYFTGVEDEIRRQFSPKYLSQGAHPYVTLERVSNTDSVAVQVRRGDYLNFASFHGVMGADYYLHGIEETGRKNVFIFTDDPAWCQENLPGEIVNTGSRHWDIKLMSACKSIVTSNSTFGWWGAWLGSRDRKIVAPKKWFQTNELDTSDVVPDRWTKI